MCLDLYLATWQETSVHKNICPSSSVVERWKGVAYLYEVKLAEERRNLVPSVTAISRNYLDLGYDWSCVSIYKRHLQAAVAPYCSLLLHLGWVEKVPSMQVVCLHCVDPTALSICERTSGYGDKKMPSSRYKLCLLNKAANIFFFSCALKTAEISHHIWFTTVIEVCGWIRVVKSCNQQCGKIKHFFNKCFYI